MGKTNLLDAIFYLCMTKSHFLNSDRDNLKHGTDFFRLEGYFQKNLQTEKVVAKVIPSKSKILERRDVAYTKLSEHIGLFPVVIVAPDDTALAVEGSEERRKFMDVTLSQSNPNYLSQLMQYNRILKQRNTLLKEAHSRGYLNNDLLQTYNNQLINPAYYIFEERRTLLEELRPLFNDFYQTIANAQEEVSCHYHSQLLEESFEHLLLANYEKDKILQRTNAGIHKDNLVFKIKDKPVKKFASQGQLKSFIIALKLAQYELLRQHKGLTPLLLLDDLFDKLDDTRVLRLMQLITGDEFGQIFISDTHPDRLEKIVGQFPINYRKFVIEHGEALPQ